MVHIDTDHIELNIRGKEKGKWTDYYYVTINDGNSTRTERRPIYRKSNREILNYKAPCWKFPPSGLMPGDYVIPISFVLP
jgi:hypothetical protein